tara:strand:+ start:3208 stop:3669 length:462 start_codon:yes stop_codon:yes gene_type:complete
MDIILLEKVLKLGNIGDTVKVKAGYARNYLIPKKIAIRATKENIKIFETKKADLEKANLAKMKEAQNLQKILPKSITLFREASEQGALFGSVTARDIAKEIETSKKVAVSAKDIILKENIKALGEYNAEVNLHAEVRETIDILVKAIDNKKES